MSIVLTSGEVLRHLVPTFGMLLCHLILTCGMVLWQVLCQSVSESTIRKFTDAIKVRLSAYGMLLRRVQY